MPESFRLIPAGLVSKLGETEEEDDAEREWEGKYELRRDAAPLLFFPAALASRAFFLGRAVRVLERTRELRHSAGGGRGTCVRVG